MDPSILSNSITIAFTIPSGKLKMVIFNSYVSLPECNSQTTGTITLWCHQTWLAGKSPNYRWRFIAGIVHHKGGFSGKLCLMTLEGYIIPLINDH